MGSVKDLLTACPTYKYPLSVPIALLYIETVLKKIAQAKKWAVSKKSTVLSQSSSYSIKIVYT